MRQRNQTDARKSQQTRPQFAVFPKIRGQQAQNGERGGNADKNALGRFVEQKTQPDERQNRDKKRQRETVNRARPRSRRARNVEPFTYFVRHKFH